MPSVLLIEDDAAVSASLAALLSELGHEVRAAPSAELGLEEARTARPALVLLDLHLPGRDGLEVLPDLLGLSPSPAVIVITAQPSAESVIDAMALGASAHLVKPVDLDELEQTVAAALQRAAPAAPERAAAPARALVGRSKPMLSLAGRVGALARSDCTVLITGESGTGKELVAAAIHERSARSAGPFVAVSCAAIPEALLEAELFGHEKGAFTGAHAERIGRVERAQGGTLFLDEVGELSPQAQAKLLRFLEARTFERVGGAGERQADVRILAATNAPLEDLVEEGAFREDLFYRLNVARVVLPPLRERREDLPLLVDHFLAAAGRPEVSVGPDAHALLLTRPWPGNVRELRNAIDAALVRLGDGPCLRAEHLPPATRAAPSGDADALSALVRARVSAASSSDEGASEEGGGLFARLKEEVERAAIAAALEATGGNQVAATRLLGMNRATLRRKMEEFGLRDA
jgi:DNA-binding NtrC family response regulator